MSVVELEIRDAVAEVRLNRPDKLNGLTLDMLDELITIGRRLRRDRRIRAVLLSGNGRSFSSGLDFGSVLRQPVRIGRYLIPVPWRGTNTFQEACWVWRRLPVPVIAVIHGHCFGAGLQLALAADFRFAAPDAELAVLESRWGLIPDMTASASLRELIGVDLAKLLTMTGKRVTGVEAARMGLVTEASDDPTATASALVEAVRARSPDAVAAAKRLFDHAWNRSTRSGFAAERRAQVRLLTTPNTTIARASGRDGSTPRFRPRGR